MFRRVGLLGVLAAAACCGRNEVKSTGSAAADPVPARPSFTVFAVAEMRGQIGPCGCTTDPLGDISRTTELVERARAAGPVMFVDAGSLLYSRAPIPAAMVTQEELKADLLAETYRKALKVDAVGLGPEDEFQQWTQDDVLQQPIEHLISPGTRDGISGRHEPTAAAVLRVSDWTRAEP